MPPPRDGAGRPASRRSDAAAPTTDAQAARGWLASFPWAAWLSSTIIHAVALVLLSMIWMTAPQRELLWLTGDFEPTSDDMELDFDALPIETSEPSLTPVDAGREIALPGDETGAIGNVRLAPPNPRGPGSGGDAPAALAPVGESAAGAFAAELAALSNPLAQRGGGLEGRTLENRLAAALSGGGTHESEAAVEAGLAWLAEHQFEDGAWRFDLEKHPRCAGYCRNSGTNTSSTAATGLALLSFLGAGYTHKEGKYQEVVDDGLYYLVSHMNITSRGGDLRDGQAAPEAQIGLGFGGRANLPRFQRDTMYAHGIAALAITEAYAMTHDRTLRQPAEDAAQFIVNAQYDDGGWRYNPKWENQGPGDMTVTGWQLAALKSAVLAGIDVPYEVWIRASAFIDGLQEDGGARYTYVSGERGTPATTAIGLLSRMVGGWPRDAKPLLKGAVQISNLAPAQNNMYFNYYASQVLHHLGGPHWEKWNPKMREYLVGTQANEGHQTGSWYFSESHSTPGGRLYTTAMAVMTLEVYYRYMPLYSEPFVGRAP
jgi:hypothetical protein